MTELNRRSERITYVDSAKGYLILLVVLGHILVVLNPDYSKLHFTAQQAFITTFHMPAFFMLHGMLFDREKYRAWALGKYLLKLFRTLIIPYFFFEGIGLFWNMFLQKLSFLTGLENMLTVRCNVGADWFLIAMFMGSFAYFVWTRYENQILEGISVAVTLCLPMAFPRTQVFIVLGRGLMAYGFITLGYLCRTILTKEKSILWLLLSFVVTGGTAVLNLKFGENDFFTCTISNPLTLILGGIGGTVFILQFAQFLNFHLVSVIGTHTLVIMGTHQLVIYAMTALLPTLWNGSILMGLLLGAVILLFEFPAVYLIERFLPFCVGRRFQLRKGKKENENS